MARLRLYLAIVMSVANFVGPALAQSSLCQPRDADAAEAMTDTIKSWKDVDTTFVRFRNCDDGSISEGNADAIANILLEHWTTLPDLAHLVVRRPGLQAFVLSHVNQTIDSEKLKRIASLSVSSCPADAERLCQQLHAAATAGE